MKASANSCESGCTDVDPAWITSPLRLSSSGAGAGAVSAGADGAGAGSGEEAGAFPHAANIVTVKARTSAVVKILFTVFFIFSLFLSNILSLSSSLILCYL